MPHQKNTGTVKKFKFYFLLSAVTIFYSCFDGKDAFGGLTPEAYCAGVAPATCEVLNVEINTVTTRAQTDAEACANSLSNTDSTGKCSGPTGNWQQNGSNSQRFMNAHLVVKYCKSSNFRVSTFDEKIAIENHQFCYCSGTGNMATLVNFQSNIAPWNGKTMMYNAASLCPLLP